MEEDEKEVPQTAKAFRCFCGSCTGEVFLKGPIQMVSWVYNDTSKTPVAVRCPICLMRLEHDLDKAITQAQKAQRFPHRRLISFLGG